MQMRDIHLWRLIVLITFTIRHLKALFVFTSNSFLHYLIKIKLSFPLMYSHKSEVVILLGYTISKLKKPEIVSLE